MKIIIPIIVGDIIGYFTNWLAIKMLFRPHYEKRIFGYKLPFTPGLIPKERYRISKSIGETVGVYLLSPDTIIEELSKPKTEENIRQWIEQKVEKLKASNKSIKDIIIGLSEKSYYTLINTIENYITSRIITQLRSEKFKSLIYKSIQDKIENIDSDNIYEVINDKLKGFLNELVISQELKDKIVEIMQSKAEQFTEDDRVLSEAIPEDILLGINKYIDENKNTIANAIRMHFKDPIIQLKIRDFIGNLIFQHVSKLILTFISPEMISEKILHIIQKYVNNEDTNKYIIMLIKSSLDKLLGVKVSEIAPKILENIGQKKYENLADLIIKFIAKEENQNILLNSVEDKLKSIEDENKKKILDYINKNIDIILTSQELEKTVYEFITEMINGITNKPIVLLIGKIGEEEVNKIYGFFRIIFDKFAREELSQIIEVFHISKIVEDKINSFEVDFVEDLILQIARKELMAITWLGALLGGIMGLLSPLLQMLY